MSAGFENFNVLGGDYMAYSSIGGVPWHGLGEALPGLATAEEMIKAAHQDWDVELRRLSFLSSSGEYVEVDGNGVVRLDTEVPLGVVGMRYKPIQNTSLFSFFDNLVADGTAMYETAGSLHGGKKVWVLAVMPDDIILWRNGQEDVTKKYILLSNSHDGSQAVRVYFTPVRVVCQNTLTASAWGATNKVSIRHTTNGEQRLSEAHNLMGFSTGYYEQMQDELYWLSKQEISFDDLLTFCDEVFPDTEAEKSRAAGKRMEVIKNFSQECERYGRDWFSAINAVTGYIDHGGVKALDAGKQENRMDKLLFGAAANLKDKAFDMSLRMSGYEKK